MRVIAMLAAIHLMDRPAYVMGSSAESVAVQHLADMFVQSKRGLAGFVMSSQSSDFISRAALNLVDRAHID